MRALVYDQRGLLVDRVADQPQPGDGEALLKIRRAGICNTDLELVAGYYDFHGSLGHEFVAEVAAAPGNWLGKRVVGEINLGCGECDMCLRQIPSQCRRRRAIGIHSYPGAFADYLTLPLDNLHPVPDRVTDDMAVFVEPLAAALQVTEAVHISPHDRVVVYGAGKLGMLVAQVLKLTGADLVVPVRREKQARLLEGWGIATADMADLRDGAADVVVEATGSPENFNRALELVRPRGTIVLKSTYNGVAQANLSRIAVNEIRVVGSRCGPFDAALRLLDAGLIDVESMIEDRYSLDNGVAAMERAAQPGTLKVLLDI